MDALADATSSGEPKDISDAERARHLDDFEKLLAGLPIAKGNAARALLREALGPNPFPVPAQAHHIFGVELFDTPLGKKLRGWAIDLNGKDNGVWLPESDFPGRTASLHSGRPTNAYTQEVIKELSDAESREEAIAILNRLRERLRSGNLKINNAS